MQHFLIIFFYSIALLVTPTLGWSNNIREFLPLVDGVLEGDNEDELSPTIINGQQNGPGHTNQVLSSDEFYLSVNTLASSYWVRMPVKVLAATFYLCSLDYVSSALKFGLPIGVDPTLLNCSTALAIVLNSESIINDTLTYLGLPTLEAQAGCKKLNSVFQLFGLAAVGSQAYYAWYARNDYTYPSPLDAAITGLATYGALTLWDLGASLFSSKSEETEKTSRSFFDFHTA